MVNRVKNRCVLFGISQYRVLSVTCCADSVDERLKLYMALQEEFPRSHVARRIPLNFTSGW